MEADYDFMFVEAHTPGQNDWTTLPITDDQGNEVSSTDTGFSCGGDGYTWHDDHPFLANYQSFIDVDTQCGSTGATGEWNAVTGNSAGWRHYNVDLSDYDGQQVELSISYVQDGAVAGLGVFLDELRTSAGAAELSKTGFEADLGGWTVSGPPEGTVFNADDWARKQAAFDEAPVIGTADSVWMTFGLEAVADPADRLELLRRSLGATRHHGPGGADADGHADGDRVADGNRDADGDPVAVHAAREDHDRAEEGPCAA